MPQLIAIPFNVVRVNMASLSFFYGLIGKSSGVRNPTHVLSPNNHHQPHNLAGMCVSINDVGVCIHSRKMHGDWAGLWLRYAVERCAIPRRLSALSLRLHPLPAHAFLPSVPILSCNTIFFGVGCEYVVSWDRSEVPSAKKHLPTTIRNQPRPPPKGRHAVFPDG